MSMRIALPFWLLMSLVLLPLQATADRTDQPTIPAGVQNDLSGTPAKPHGEQAGNSATAVATVEESEEDVDRLFLRVERDDRRQPLRMQTSIVRYEVPGPNGSKVAVDLVGAIHIGDSSYFDELNEIFEGYDVVLYELVAPEDTRVPRGGGPTSTHPIGMLQLGMKEMLGLDHQLACVDYQVDNFVHADMSPERFEQTMADRGESMWTMFFRMMGQGIAMQSNNENLPSDAEFLAALFARDRELRLKRLLSVMFEDLESTMAVFDGPDGSTIITERNKVALAKLREQIDAGEQEIAIFYGAGHLPDMQERLLKEFGAKRVSVRWLTAWDMTGE